VTVRARRSPSYWSASRRSRSIASYELRVMSYESRVTYYEPSSRSASAPRPLPTCHTPRIAPGFRSVAARPRRSLTQSPVSSPQSPVRTGFPRFRRGGACLPRAALLHWGLRPLSKPCIVHHRGGRRATPLRREEGLRRVGVHPRRPLTQSPVSSPRSPVRTRISRFRRGGARLRPLLDALAVHAFASQPRTTNYALRTAFPLVADHSSLVTCDAGGPT